MDVPTVAPAASGQSEGVPQAPEASTPQQTPAVPSGSSTSAPSTKSTQNSTLAAAVAKLYNVTSGSSGEPAELSVSYKYVSQLQLVVTVFTNPQTGEEVAQFPPQELIGLAELFDQIDGVTLDRKV